MPTSDAEWKQIADQFETLWQFPMCIGAIDGKHISIQCPNNSGSYYYNYKHTYSIVLMAVADAFGKFIFVDVGQNGRISDGGIIRNCKFLINANNGRLNLPAPRMLPNSNRELPYTFIADEAFPLKPFLMKPFPERNMCLSKRIFNYRLSRARRIVENAFGILTNRFRIFKKQIELQPDKATAVTLACVVLHNMLQSDQNTSVSINEICQANNLNHNIFSLPATENHNSSDIAKSTRNQWLEYFINEGAVDFQWKEAFN
jgi:hypothetical protein